MAHLRGAASRWWRSRRQQVPPTAEAELLHRMRRELRDLGIHPPLHMARLCQALGERRGRPIELEARQLTTLGPSGLLVETSRRDVIIYQAETTRLHQDHIILHELGHILVADDAGDEESEDAVETWAGLIPVFENEMIRRVTQRCSYESEEECVVEAAATSLLEWSSVEGATPLAEDPSLRRVQSVVGDQRGWW
ncbi:hypothetical protein [Streptomyces ochraceiscleroticus]|uniref:IrrE N-terminal-like domain-containing protein n=1 Tax=Streptomyces ochraceiscleroticus TaxID=47761 RepID=A0ABW1MUR1_9ACTN|nr:hypothetical protein [Streptomyces ochraceiscleroticus]